MAASKKQPPKKEQSKEEQKKNTVVGLVFIIVVIFIAFKACSGGSDNTSSKREKSQSSNTPEGYFEDIYKSYEDLTMVNTDNNGLKISYTDTGDHWDESAFVRDNISKYIKFCEKLYDNSEYQSVYVSVFTNLTDSKGNQENTNVLTMSMTRAVFKTYTWDNLKYTSIYNQFTKDCSIFDIHPVLSKNLDIEKVYYN